MTTNEFLAALDALDAQHGQATALWAADPCPEHDALLTALEAARERFYREVEMAKDWAVAV